MAELRGAGDEPEYGDASARRFAADAGSGANEARQLHEPSPRAEYADVVRQQAEKPNTAQADATRADADQVDTPQEKPDETDTAPEDVSQEDADHPTEAPDDAGQANADPGGRTQTETAPEDAARDEADQADAGQRAANQAETNPEDRHQTDSGQDGADQEETDQGTEGSIADLLERFDPRRAGLPEVSRAEAAAYIEEHLADRPWLAPARDCSPDVQRVIVALDQGHGHAHIRHEGWVTEEMNERRVRKLEDPAQLDQGKREAGIDGLAASDLPHRCGDNASRITDPEAFAKAFARGVEHPEVRAALDSNGPRPEAVILPISEVLGDDGHKFCSGWQLEAINGSMDEARANRREWAAGNLSGPEPQARAVETFEGGTVTFAFRRSPVGGYQISTMYVNPPDDQPV